MSSGSPIVPAPMPQQSAVGPIAAFFDLDKTILAKSSAFAFNKEFYASGLMTWVAALRGAYSHSRFLLAGADHDQTEKMRHLISSLVTGWEVDIVRDIVAESLHTIVDPIVYDEAVALIEEHQQAGHDVIIISAGGYEIVKPIGDLLGVDHVVATQLEVADGRFTGQLEFYAYADNKAAAMRELASRHGYDLHESFAYTDSITDAPMLEAVGHPYAVNPDKQLRQLAVENQWPILVFDTPVALGKGGSLRPVTTALAAAAVVGAAALGATWWRRVARRAPA